MARPRGIKTVHYRGNAPLWCACKQRLPRSRLPTTRPCDACDLAAPAAALSTTNLPARDGGGCRERSSCLRSGATPSLTQALVLRLSGAPHHYPKRSYAPLCANAQAERARTVLGEPGRRAGEVRRRRVRARRSIIARDLWPRHACAAPHLINARTDPSRGARATGPSHRRASSDAHPHVGPMSGGRQTCQWKAHHDAHAAWLMMALEAEPHQPCCIQATDTRRSRHRDHNYSM